MATPSLPQFNYEIGARFAKGDWQGAGQIAAHCRAAYPGDVSGWIYGSMAELFAGKPELALEYVEQAMVLEPRNVQVWLQRAECLHAAGNRDAALVDASRATEFAEKDPQAVDAIAKFLLHIKDYSGALAAFEQLHAIRPKESAPLCEMATIHQYLGQFEAAERNFRAALAIAPDNAAALSGLAELTGQPADSTTLARMETALAATEPRSTDAALLHFGLSKVYEDIGQYENSWRHLTAGNSIERSRLRYDGAQDRATFELILQQFTEVEVVCADGTGQRPIFVVGMPRTGTTLVERIISSHSEVVATGESPAFTDAISAVVERTEPEASRVFTSFLHTLTRLDPRSIAAEYLARVATRRDDRLRFLDKTTLNFFYCPLILRAFPNARIVHLTRHPLASCFAIYQTRFSGGFPFAYDLNEIADFYIGYHMMMSEWHRILPGRIFDASYEDMIGSQESATRRLLAYLDLPFESACLNFHLNTAPVNTASLVQVRQPLYSSSLERWRHYELQLAPLCDRLTTAGILSAAH